MPIGSNKFLRKMLKMPDELPINSDKHNAHPTLKGKTIWRARQLHTTCLQVTYQMEKPYPIEEGVYRVQLILPKSLEHTRSQFEHVLLSAQRRTARFAKKHGWGDLTKESFFDHAEIFDSKEAFDEALAKVSGILTPVQFPKTYSAALENRVLMAVSSKLYDENYAEGIEEDSYEKLMAHEIAHRLHIRILNGNEDAMGPTWFFEGFAIYAADQFKKHSSKLDAAEIKRITESSERQSYRKYGYAFRYFARKATVKELIEHAAKKDFQKWLVDITE
jgi:hypothetical protein